MLLKIKRASALLQMTPAARRQRAGGSTSFLRLRPANDDDDDVFDFDDDGYLAL